MLMENTGIAMMDSGGGEGRHWQRNAKHNPRIQPEVSLDFKAPCKSDDVGITVNLYHYLPMVLQLDDVCDEFNSKFANMENWDSEIYGVSKEAAKWLDLIAGFEIGDSWNTYNGENILSQTLQGTNLKKDGLGEGEYLLLQVHGGADVRGGYTDAKMFANKEFQRDIDPVPNVWANLISHARQTEISLEMRESGYGFVDENGEAVEILEGDTIEAGLDDV